MSDSDPSQWSAAPRPLGGGASSRVWEITTTLGPRAVKVGPVERLAHEARTLTELDGSAVAPALVAAGDGILVTERCDGDPRPADSWGSAEALALGRLVAAVHATQTTAWRQAGDDLGRQVSAEAYLSSRLEAITGHRTPARRAVIDAVLGRPPAADVGDGVRLHGDLWSANVLWCPDGPVLVDWEYSHQGDRAEELAYLAEMDGLDQPSLDAVLDGYGADARLRGCVERWRPLVAVWCGLWFADHGDPARCAQMFARAARRLSKSVG